MSLSNPARIAPRIYLPIPDALAAIEEEWNRITTPDRDGVPTLVLVHHSSPVAEGFGKLFIAMVVKGGMDLKYKASLCGHGDLWKPDAPLDFASSAVSGRSPRLLISMCEVLSPRLVLLGIATARAQSDLLGKPQRCSITNPPSVHFTMWGKGGRNAFWELHRRLFTDADATNLRRFFFAA